MPPILALGFAHSTAPAAKKFLSILPFQLIPVPSSYSPHYGITIFAIFMQIGGTFLSPPASAFASHFRVFVFLVVFVTHWPILHPALAPSMAFEWIPRFQSSLKALVGWDWTLLKAAPSDPSSNVPPNSHPGLLVGTRIQTIPDVFIWSTIGDI